MFNWQAVAFSFCVNTPVIFWSQIKVNINLVDAMQALIRNLCKEYVAVIMIKRYIVNFSVPVRFIRRAQIFKANTTNFHNHSVK